MNLLLAALIIAPLVSGVVAAALGRSHPGTAAGTVRAATLLSFVAAVAVAGEVATAGPVQVLLGGSSPLLVADRLGSAVLLLITGLAAVITSFAARYLVGDPAAHRFFPAAGLLVAATAAAATAATLVGLAVAWTLTGLALCLLVDSYPRVPAARAGARRTAWAVAVGDLALWAGVLLVVARSGNPALRDLGEAVGEGPLTHVVGVLFVLSALARSAQLPFVRWLPATLAAPTPVSALLHAGVVNAGGLLLIRTAPVVGASGWAVHLAFAAGAATAVYGTALALTSPDVKGGLAMSTSAQMGFMVMACALGAWAAAVVHLVAHGMWKASLFLGAGSAVGAAGRKRRLPPARLPSARQRLGILAAAAVLPSAALLLAGAIGAGYAGDGPGAAVVLTFAWATGAAVVWGWLGREPTVRAAVRAAGLLAVAAPAYLLVAGAVGAYIRPSVVLPDATAPSVLLLALPLAALVALTVLRTDRAGLGRVSAALYVRLLGAGAARGRPAGRSRRPPARAHRARAPRPPSRRVVPRSPLVTSTRPAPATHRVAEHVRLRSDVRRAAQVLATTWPISTVIAVNPLAGLEQLPFGEAVAVAGEALGARGTPPEEFFRAAYRAGRVTRADLEHALRHRARTDGTDGDDAATVDLLVAHLLDGPPAPRPVRRDRTRSEALAPDVAAEVDALTTTWLAAYFGGEASGWPMPGRELGFYRAWRALAPLDRTLPRAARTRLRRLPDTAEDAVLEALEDLRVPGSERTTYLRAHLTRMPGWAGHVRWRGDRDAGIDLVDHLALRLSYEYALLPPGAVGDAPAGTPEPGRGQEPSLPDRTLLWLGAYEHHYRTRLLSALSTNRPPAPPAPPASQVVFCIDVRSEGLRRRLEEAGPHETLGFAGFFAVAVRFTSLAGGASSDQCPVLIRPRNDAAETPAPGGEDAARRHLGRLRDKAAAGRGMATAKTEPVAPFALAEAAGWVAGPLAAARTLAPGPFAAARERLRTAVVPDAPTVVDVLSGFTAEERLHLAHVTLTTMGLVDGFARLVVLCGHGSTTENNPYASALDCGACGGSPGGPNARAAAALLNDADVRTGLAGRGVVVPDDTWFVAAQHDTATDRVRLLDRHLVPAGHHADLDRLAADLDAAGDRLAAERCAVLPGAPRDDGLRRAARHVRRRSADWAQVFPEWGLAGNAAFVVGPRSMTAGLDLGRRVFLHSYEAAADPDGAALETILTAPLVVAQWINCQYYFSSVDPEVFGAGTKTVHNVVGDVGVLSGAGGDLRQGLPWQSVGMGRDLVHEPMRLLAAVQAPPARVDGIVARNRALQDLLANDWLALVARERPSDAWQRWTSRGFLPWAEQEEESR